MKLCVDCKFYRPYSSWAADDEAKARFSKCGHPSLLSPIDGQPDEFCEFSRRVSGVCKPDGLLFEAAPKRLWWRFW